MTFQEIDAQTAQQWLKQDEATLIDVREAAEYAIEHIAGSRLMPLSTITPQTSLSDGSSAHSKVIITCQRGARGSQACARLMQAEGTVIYNLKDGLNGWKASGLPVERSSRSSLPLDRQVQLVVGVCVLTFSVLAMTLHPLFALGSAFMGAGLTNAGITGWCGLGLALARMPWNR